MRTVPMFIKRFMAKQLAHPSGIFGRLVMGRFLNTITSAHNQLVLKQLALSPADRILEVGFGGGALLDGIVRLVPEGSVAGVELSDEMLSNARSRFRSQIAAGSVELRHGDVRSLPFPDASFDKACSVNTVYFWPDLASALGEFSRVIRPGGVLVLGFNAADDLRSDGLHQLGFVPYSAQDIAEALEAQGFRPGPLQSGTDSRGTFFSLHAERVTNTASPDRAGMTA